MIAEERCGTNLLGLLVYIFFEKLEEEGTAISPALIELPVSDQSHLATVLTGPQVNSRAASSLQKVRRKREIRGQFVVGTLLGTPAEMARQAAPFRAARYDIKAPVMHYSLSLQKGDGRKTLVQWGAMVKRFLELMKFPLHGAWVCFLHDDTAHQHVHIAFLRSTGDGGLWNREFSAKRAIAATAQLEREFGLLTHDRTVKALRPRKTVEERRFESHLKKQGKITDKSHIANVLDQFMQATQGRGYTLGQMHAFLAAHEVQVEMSQQAAKKFGIKFGYGDFWVSGSTMGHRYKACSLLNEGLINPFASECTNESAHVEDLTAGGDEAGERAVSALLVDAVTQVKKSEAVAEADGAEQAQEREAVESPATVIDQYLIPLVEDALAESVDRPGYSHSSVLRQDQRDKAVKKRVLRPDIQLDEDRKKIRFSEVCWLSDKAKFMAYQFWEGSPQHLEALEQLDALGYNAEDAAHYDQWLDNSGRGRVLDGEDLYGYIRRREVEFLNDKLEFAARYPLDGIDLQVIEDRLEQLGQEEKNSEIERERPRGLI